MDKLKISDYLQKYYKRCKKGDCKACGKLFLWANLKVMQHKRSTFPNATAEEKSFFAKRPASEMASKLQTRHENSMDVASGSGTLTSSLAFTDEKKAKIDSALAKYYYRSGIPFQTVESKAFHSFIALLDPDNE